MPSPRGPGVGTLLHARSLTPVVLFCADIADPPSTTPTTTEANSELAGVDARDEDEPGPLASEEVAPRAVGALLVSRSPEAEKVIERATFLRLLRLRADFMFIHGGKTVIESQMGFCAVEKVTGQHLIDVRNVVDELFDQHQHTGRFVGIVDRQQARGWLLADLAGRLLLEPGTARAERGTARGVGNDVAKEAKVQEAVATAAAAAAKKRAKRGCRAEATEAAMARAAVLEATARDLGLPPPPSLSRRDVPRVQRQRAARGPVAAPAAAVSWAEVKLRLQALDEAEKADDALRDQIILRQLKRCRERDNLELQLETAI